MVRTWLSCAATAAALAVAGGAQAGIDGSGLTFTEIMVGGGYVDVENPFNPDYADFLDLSDPSPGSFLEIAGADPGYGSLNAGISFGSFNNGVALFSFWSNLTALPFGDVPGADLAFAGQRVSFTTVVPVMVTLIGSVQATGTGVGFLEIYADGDIDGEFFTPGDNPVVVQFMLEAGTYDLAMGGATTVAGGFASFDGTLAIVAIPSPGVMALLGVAGLVARRRRR